MNSCKWSQWAKLSKNDTFNNNINPLLSLAFVYSAYSGSSLFITMNQCHSPIFPISITQTSCSIWMNNKIALSKNTYSFKENIWSMSNSYECGDFRSFGKLLLVLGSVFMSSTLKCIRLYNCLQPLGPCHFQTNIFMYYIL